MLEHLDKIFIASSILVPGFILDRTLGYYSPKKNVESTLHFFTLGLLNLVICAPLIYAKLDQSLTMITLHFISPLAIGSTWGFLRDRETFGRLLEFFNIKLVHPCPTAWDYKFHSVKFENYLVVTLNNGTVYAGKFSSKSFASSEYAGRDIYMEKEFAINNNGEWEPLANSGGIFINNGEIKHIKFYNGI